MKIKDLSNIKTLTLTIIFFLVAGASLAGFFALPSKVKKVEKKVTNNTANLGKVAQNLDKYMAVNEEYKAQQMEHKSLMLELIRQKKDK